MKEQKREQEWEERARLIDEHDKNGQQPADREVTFQWRRHQITQPQVQER